MVCELLHGRRRKGIMKHADLWDDMERDEPNPTTCGFNNEKSIRECDPPIPDTTL